MKLPQFFPTDHPFVKGCHPFLEEGLQILRLDLIFHIIQLKIMSGITETQGKAALLAHTIFEHHELHEFYRNVEEWLGKCRVIQSLSLREAEEEFVVTQHTEKELHDSALPPVRLVRSINLSYFGCWVRRNCLHIHQTEDLRRPPKHLPGAKHLRR